MSEQSVQPAKRDRRAFTIKQVCEMTGFCAETIYRRIRSGELIARKCGRRTIVLAADLDRFLEDLPALDLTGEAP
jgi:excisionase family DNA binding protein